MKKIGIPVSKSKTQFYINQAYIDFVIGSGYTIDLIVQSDLLEKNIKDYYTEKATECDGLLLCGGVDIDPIFYGEDNLTSTKTEPDKDKFERELLFAFSEQGKPVFGICRGFQLMAREYIRTNGSGEVTSKNDVYFSFFQNVTDHNDVARLDVPRDQPTSFVNIDYNSLYLPNNKNEKLINKIAINSIHHQGVILSGPKIKAPIPINRTVKITAWKQHSGIKPSGIVVEAVDFGTYFGKGKVSGVQWHPEELKDYALLHKIFGEPKKDMDAPKQNEGVILEKVIKQEIAI